MNKYINLSKYADILIGAILALFIMLPATSHAQSILTATNGGIAFRVWNGSTGNVVIASAVSSISVTMEDGLATSNNLTTQTVSSVGVTFSALTNKAGAVRLTFDGSLSLPTDAVSNNLIAATITNAPFTWANVFWDSSKTKWQGVGVPRAYQMDRYTGNMIPDPLRPAAVWLQASRVVGQPLGSGTLTQYLYVGGNLAWQKATDSPYYVLGASGGGTNATVATDTIYLSDTLGFPIGSQQAMIYRAARATASTNGLISVIIKNADQVQGLSP